MVYPSLNFYFVKLRAESGESNGNYFIMKFYPHLFYMWYVKNA